VISRCNILLTFANKSWGWTTSNLRKVYVALNLSVMLHQVGSRGLFAQTNLDKLEQTQNKALRKVTGQQSTTPVEAIRAEAGVVSYMPLEFKRCQHSCQSL